MMDKLFCAAMFALCVSAAACTSRSLEISTTQYVDVFEVPKRPGVAGNRKVGVLPPFVALPVKKEVIEKDLAAYEIDYRDPKTGGRMHGYVLLGTPGLQIREQGS